MSRIRPRTQPREPALARRIERALPLELPVHLRAVSTPPERVLWSSLRAKKLGGMKFRRQAPIGPFVVDFLCAAASLVVEIDGRVHEGHHAADASRDDWLRSQGYKVVRFSASQVSKDTDAVLREILKVARELREQRTAGDTKA